MDNDDDIYCCYCYIVDDSVLVLSMKCSICAYTPPFYDEPRDDIGYMGLHWRGKHPILLGQRIRRGRRRARGKREAKKVKTLTKYPSMWP